MDKIFLFNGVTQGGQQCCTSFAARLHSRSEYQSRNQRKRRASKGTVTIPNNNLKCGVVCLKENGLSTAPKDFERIIIGEKGSELEHALLAWLNRMVSSAAEILAFGFDIRLLKSLNDNLESKRVQMHAHHPTEQALHELFGCTDQCKIVCAHCKANYNKCVQAELKLHTTIGKLMICRNNGCEFPVPKCTTNNQQTIKHIKLHMECRCCYQAGMICMDRCINCRDTHCCNQTCPQMQKSRNKRIADLGCPIGCRKFGSRQGLISHIQNCPHAFLWKTPFETCNCGIRILDEEHRKKHKAPKGKTCSPAPPPPRFKREANDETHWYIAQEDGEDPPSIRAISTQILRALDIEGDRSLLFTLSHSETAYIKAAAEDVCRHLQAANLNIARIPKQGSLAKITAVPGFVDVDLMVMFNQFVATPEGRRSLRSRVTTALQSLKGMTVNAEGAADIMVCSYKDVPIDLILVGEDDRMNDDRAKGLKQGLQDVEKFKTDIGTNGWVLDVVRACKYWSKRHMFVDKLKSVLVEHIVLSLWKQVPRGEKETLHAAKQSLFQAFLDYLKNRGYEPGAGKGAPDPLIGECMEALRAFTAHLNPAPSPDGKVLCQLCGV